MMRRVWKVVAECSSYRGGTDKLDSFLLAHYSLEMGVRTRKGYIKML